MGNRPSSTKGRQGGEPYRNEALKKQIDNDDPRLCVQNREDLLRLCPDQPWCTTCDQLCQGAVCPDSRMLQCQFPYTYEDIVTWCIEDCNVFNHVNAGVRVKLNLGGADGATKFIQDSEFWAHEVLRDLKWTSNITFELDDLQGVRLENVASPLSYVDSLFIDKEGAEYKAEISVRIRLDSKQNVLSTRDEVLNTSLCQNYDTLIATNASSVEGYYWQAFIDVNQYEDEAEDVYQSKKDQYCTKFGIPTANCLPSGCAWSYSNSTDSGLWWQGEYYVPVNDNDGTAEPLLDELHLALRQELSRRLVEEETEEGRESLLKRRMEEDRERQAQMSKLKKNGEKQRKKQRSSSAPPLNEASLQTEVEALSFFFSEIPPNPESPEKAAPSSSGSSDRDIVEEKRKLMRADLKEAIDLGTPLVESTPLYISYGDIVDRISGVQELAGFPVETLDTQNCVYRSIDCMREDATPSRLDVASLSARIISLYVVLPFGCFYLLAGISESSVRITCS
uniref:Uncharacterized protein n=1 Tax=Chromera velia CCMP2878 TaxID=1169474 RepID=A0A0G4GJS6_9ALVE|eukprot:Cvel_22215.t1-p1 / transcript=Cvel_22215.t1 / gene=Cvel_22215 / organism=Chromera_velia_CCMP2878 / gene_product=hypothetical protein / transcript_product=hypothetical protein / location=Cvel_scaffold2159:22525-32264(-) / protein_length=506 / sequence_SO=supercontig / SO=protein_coding / is_pseudo=false